jgi:hypothetical protein
MATRGHVSRGSTQDGEVVNYVVALALDAVLNLVSDQVRRKRQGQIGQLTALLSLQQQEINILLGGVSTNKFNKN